MTMLGLVLLAGAFIPTVSTGCGGGNSNQAASRAQLSNYVTALQMFKGEYGHYPAFFEGQSEINLGKYPNSERFIQALSGRDKNGQRIAVDGNRRMIAFHSFAESELLISETTGYRQVVDRFENPYIVLCIDHDNDGYVEVPDDGELVTIRATATAYSIETEDAPAIQLW